MDRSNEGKLEILGSHDCTYHLTVARTPWRLYHSFDRAAGLCHKKQNPV